MNIMMEKQYHNLLEHILTHGTKVEDRTGVGTLSVLGYQMKFDLSEGFPAVTTKKLAWRAVVGELLWFLEGSTDERRLAELTYGKHRTELVDKTTIWTANANEQGRQLGYVNNDFRKELGPVYGAQWRNWKRSWGEEGFDQLSNLVHDIKNNPTSRRLILTAWNPLAIPDMALPPCHVLAQFRVLNGKLSCMLTQRSADSFLGVPFNIASYSLLTHLLARECNLEPGHFIHSIFDVHIYLNHIDQVKEQLTRKPYNPPRLIIDESFDLGPILHIKSSRFSLDASSKMRLENYKSHDAIKAPMAV